MDNKTKYECIKDISKALRKNYKDIIATSYGYCCGSDYFGDRTVDKDYVGCKLFRGGANNDWDWYWKEFRIGDTEYYYWDLEHHDVNEVVAVMNEVAKEYGAEIRIPYLDDGAIAYGKCLEIEFKNAF